MIGDKIERVKGERLLYLTTKGRRTGRPHEVELWFAFSNGKIYLSHEGPYTDWMKNLQKEPRVRVRIGRLEFDGEARIVEGGEARERGMRSLYEKYYGPAPREVIEDWFELSTVVELEPKE